MGTYAARCWEGDGYVVCRDGEPITETMTRAKAEALAEKMNNEVV